MWWNDNKDIQESLKEMNGRLGRLEKSMLELEYKTSRDTFDLSDKYNDYMKNTDKLNSMVNEFKGCISMSRGSLVEKKEFDEYRTILRNMIETFQKYYDQQKGLEYLEGKVDKIIQHVNRSKPKKKRILKESKDDCTGTT